MGRRRKHAISSPRAIVLMAIVLATLAMAAAVTWVTRPLKTSPAWGITYSSVYAKELGLDPHEAFTALLRDLHVRRVRLPIYWSSVERARDQYDWSDVDWLIDEAERYNTELVVAVGVKVPRWPECFIPDWIDPKQKTAFDAQVLEFVEMAVERYKHRHGIIRWQVENEPFLVPFGVCPKPDPERVKAEVSLVRSLDDRLIQMTVSGELEPWFDVAYEADVLGISMYRVTWNDYFGFFYYPLTPGFYYTRAQSVLPFVDKVVISELQAEPWFPEPIENRSLAEWYDVFDADLFRKNIDFAQRTKLPEVSLWGAEWWYVLKQNGDDRLWNVAQDLFQD